MALLWSFWIAGCVSFLFSSNVDTLERIFKAVVVPVPSYLENSGAVVSAFGYWPAFHDAAVHHFLFSAKDGGSVELLIHGWEMTGVVDERGYYKLVKHHLVKFMFRDITEADLNKFIPDNILFELGFSSTEEFKTNGTFRVTLDSAIGGNLCGSFSAKSGVVTEVTPCDGKGQTKEQNRSAVNLG
jgi:hypothetical protein